jgi:hypothetical protein
VITHLLTPTQLRMIVATHDLMWQSRHWSKGGKHRQIREWHVDFKWIQGPTRYPKRLQTHHAPGTDLGVHLPATGRKHSRTCDPPGLADPRIDQTNLGSVDPGVPCSACTLVPKCSSRIWSTLSPEDIGCPWPINRRGGGSFMHITHLIILSHL